jgi:PAS domain-containing protein
MKEHSMQKDKWLKKELELKNEIELYQKTNQRLFVEQAKIGNGEIIKNVISMNGDTPPKKPVQLPQIDLKAREFINSSEVMLPISSRSDSLTEKTRPPSELSHSPLILRSQAQELSAESSSTRAFSSPGQKNSHNIRELYVDIFTYAPCPMCILNNNYRIWRVNEKFCEMIACSEQSLLGLRFSDITIGIEMEVLPKMLGFDIVQGLALCKPTSELNSTLSNTEGKRTVNQKKTFFKTNVQIACIGTVGQKYQTVTKQVKTILKAPLFVLNFIRQNKCSTSDSSLIVET